MAMPSRIRGGEPARGRRPIFMGQPIGAHVLEERVLPSREFFSPPGLGPRDRRFVALAKKNAHIYRGR